MTGRATRARTIVVATTLVLAAMTLASCQAPTTVLSGRVTSSASDNGIAGIAGGRTPTAARHSSHRRRPIRPATTTSPPTCFPTAPIASASVTPTGTRA